MSVQAEPFLSRCSHLREEVSAAWSSADGWWQLSGREPHGSAAGLAARINSQCAWTCLPSSSLVVLLPLSLPYLHPTAGLEKGISPGNDPFLIFSPFFCSGCIPLVLALLHSSFAHLWSSQSPSKGWSFEGGRQFFLPFPSPGLTLPVPGPQVLFLLG